MKLKKILRNSILSFPLVFFGTCAYIIRPLDKPSWYNTEWNRMSEFMGVKAEQPRYYTIRGEGFPCPKNLLRKKCSGLYVAGGFLFLAKEDINDSNLVRHEMFHALGIWDEDVVDRLVDDFKRKGKVMYH